MRRILEPVLVLRYRGLRVKTREKLLAAKGGPQLTASKENDMLVLKLHGIKFCQHLSEQGSRLKSFQKGVKFANTLVLAQ